MSSTPESLAGLAGRLQSGPDKLTVTRALSLGESFPGEVVG